MEIVIAIIGSGALSSLIGGVITLIGRRMDRNEEEKAKKDEMVEVKKQLRKLEKDSVRTQLLLLMVNFPENQQEIEEVAQHYFIDCGGNWYMTNLFGKWLTENKYGEPAWFQRRKK